MNKRQSKKKTKYVSRELPGTSQQSLFSETETACVTSETVVHGKCEFINPSPEKIFIGNERLSSYLKSNDLGWVIDLRSLLEESDFTPLMNSYSPSGRRPTHPLIILGLIMYGIIQRQWSLRELESVAKRDVAAWWICAGKHPDHSTIGRFINRHEDILTEEYFISLTQLIVKKLKLSTAVVAADGTVVEAAASAYKTIKRQAAEQLVEELKKKARQNPDDPAIVTASNKAKKVVEAIEKREIKRREYRGNISNIRVSSVEPEAVIQKTKKGNFRPSYVPSVLANENQIIIGTHVDSANENNAIKPMMKQTEKVTGKMSKTLLCDAGYHNEDVLSLSNILDVEILCPSGRADAGEWIQQQRKNQLFHKNKFVFNKEKNKYICPANKELSFFKNSSDHGKPRYAYRCSDYDICQIRDKCTKISKGRIVYRYEVDKLKDQMNDKFKNREVRLKYTKRKQMVEPIFAEIKKRQGLERFRRKGLSKVTVEFTLHCIAHNLKKAV